MLVLTRKRGERIIVGDEIVIEVLEILRDKVRIGISAPSEVSIHREEVYEALQREGREFIRSGGTHSDSD